MAAALCTREVTAGNKEGLGHSIFAHLAIYAHRQLHGVVALVVPECGVARGSHPRLHVNGRERAAQRRAECVCQVRAHRWYPVGCCCQVCPICKRDMPRLQRDQPMMGSALPLLSTSKLVSSAAGSGNTCSLMSSLLACSMCAYPSPLVRLSWCLMMRCLNQL